MYQVRLSRPVLKALDRLPQHDYLRLKQAIDSLTENPRPLGIEPVKSTPFQRIRVGAYRIVYQIDDHERIIIIVRIARRTERTYKGL
ncbi:MAG TPA: type II toxin-antitoxin system RelE/ParE family toxin [Dehalococcoidia bacterium]|nr:type II toxin-antitoxin system RelE/ParE family toxin [Dehalococcoidia bacterium]